MIKCSNDKCNKYHTKLVNNCVAYHDVTTCKNFIADKSQPNKIQPSYYSNNNSLDVIDFCQMLDLDFMQGNVIKYIVRYKNKNGIEDVKKAREYCDRIIKQLDNLSQQENK